MPIIEPDLSQVGPIKPGTYNARCVSANPKKSKEKGTPMVELTSAIEVDGDEREKMDWLIISGKAAFKFEQFLRAVGMDDDANRLMNGEKVQIDTDVFIGATYSVVVEADTYNDAPTDRIASYLKR